MPLHAAFYQEEKEQNGRDEEGWKTGHGDCDRKISQERIGVHNYRAKQEYFVGVANAGYANIQ
jgi:hypothetical protein